MAKKQKRQARSTSPLAQPRENIQRSGLETRSVTGGASPSSPVTVVESKGIRRTPSSSIFEFNPDYTPVIRDLKRIGILAGSFLAILIALSFILN